MKETHYGYVRVSTEMQVERESLKTQATRLEAHFVATGAASSEVITDAGFSAKDTSRPGLQQLLRLVKAGKVASVVVTRLDRLTRSIRDLLKLLELFEEHEVRFVSLSQNLDTSTPMGRFMLQLLGILAELERGLISERVSEDMRIMARKGKWLGGPVPYGYRVVDGRLAIEPAEADVVREIYEGYVSKRSLRGVTVALNDNGKRTRRGKTWAATTIRRILTSRTYRGVTVFGKRRTQQQSGKIRPADPEDWVVAEDTHPPIVDQETFDRVQSLLPGTRFKPTKGNRVYLLSGLARCGKCGGGLSPARQQRGERTWTYYKCHRHSARGSAACPGNSVRMADLDQVVVAKLRELAQDRVFLRNKALALDVLKAASEGERRKPERKPLEDQASRLDGKLSRLIELFEDEAIDLDTFKRRKTNLDAQLVGLREQLTSLDEVVVEARVAEEVFEQAFLQVQRFGSDWEQFDEVGRQIAVRSVVKAVVVHDDQVEIQVLMDRDEFPVGCEAVPHGQGFMAATN